MDSESASGLLDSMGVGPTSKKSSCCPSLTFTQRVIGYGICLLVGIEKKKNTYFLFLGVILEIVSFLCFFSGVSLTRFAILYSLGNVVTILGYFLNLKKQYI